MKKVMGFFLLLMILLPPPAMAETTYIGSKKCMSCTRPIYEM